jgi:hypothetical protein
LAIAPFSHPGINVAKVLSHQINEPVATLTYRPAKVPAITVHTDQGLAINQFRPSWLRPVYGDVTPWLNYTARLFPIKSDCKQVLRWVATLVACPDVKMRYSMLLISEAFGVGKNTLTDAVLAPLVGQHNCSWPKEKQVLDSQFNAWVVNKCLIIVSEIYSGHGMKMYNQLKDYVADRDIEAHLKYMNPYHIDNYAHLVLCSNYPKALIIAEGDRRWLVPEVAEAKLSLADAQAFRSWLSGGGLEVIAYWADNFDDYVIEGEESPLTLRKQRLMHEQMSDAMKEAQTLGEALNDLAENDPAVPKAMPFRWVRDHLLNMFGPTVVARDADDKLRAVMLTGGNRWTVGREERIRFANIQEHYVLLNRAMQNVVEQCQQEALAKGKNQREVTMIGNELIREQLIHPEALLAW